jgi:hypothetical protein
MNNTNLINDIEEIILLELMRCSRSGISYKELINIPQQPFGVVKQVIRKMVEDGKLETKHESDGKKVYPVNPIKFQKEERKGVLMNLVVIEVRNGKTIQGVMVEENPVSVVLVDTRGNVVAIPSFEIEKLTSIRRLTPQEEEVINTMFKASEQYSKSMDAVSRMVKIMSSERIPEKKEFLTFDHLERHLNSLGYKNLLTLTRREVIVTASNDIVAVIVPMAIEPITFEKENAKSIAELLNVPLGDLPAETFYKKLNALLKDIPVSEPKVDDKSNKFDPFDVKKIFIIDEDSVPEAFKEAIENGDITQALGSIISAFVGNIGDFKNNK